MKWATLVLLFVTSAVAQPPEPTPTPPIDRKVELRLSLVGKKHEFYIGEIIPIKLAFSSKFKKRYQLNEAQYDRSGRMDYEHFAVTPDDGVIDPLASYFDSGIIFMGGGLTGFRYLTAKPWTIQLNLNEWVRFTKPGDYQLTVSSKRVETVDSSKPYGTRPITAISNQVALKILPVDHAWEKQAYDKAMATLRAANPRDFEDGESTAYHGLETLRFLGTADAARELVNQLRADRAGNSECYFGLVSSPERAVAREALDQALSDPDRPLGDTLLDAMSWFERGGAKLDQNQESERERTFLQKLVDALPNKHGDALRVSLYTVLNRALTHDPPQLPKETIQKLASQLIPMFDQLPTEKQQVSLGWNWDGIKSPALVPTLKRFAETDLSKVPREDYVNALWRTSWALRRWYELDPVGARPAIIREITRSKPLFGANTLGILPDKTLPEVDQALAKNFCSADGAFPELASLIARYASGAILPEVLKHVDRHIDSECGIPSGILAYILRVDPAAAKPRIEKTIALCAKNGSRCMCRTLTDVAAIYYDPALEEIAVRNLDNPDPQTAANAATMLGKFGSAAAEPPLWRRFEKWSKRWAGHESELGVTQADYDPEDYRNAQMALGRSLCEALATGQAWLPDEAKLRRLATVSKVPTIVDDAERFLEQPKRNPLTLSIDCSPMFHAGLAQYTFRSMNALKQKLGQFPAGTKFILWWPSVEQQDQSCIADLRAFLTDHGMSLEEEKKPAGD
jgi:tetratricopeptide (TPR) repeat protein